MGLPKMNDAVLPVVTVVCGGTWEGPNTKCGCGGGCGGGMTAITTVRVSVVLVDVEFEVVLVQVVEVDTVGTTGTSVRRSFCIAQFNGCVLPVVLLL